MPHDGLVLCGGSGRRFGGPKAIAPFDGGTLVEHAVRILAARCAAVIAVSRPDIPLPPLGVPVVHDLPGPDAPINALRTGLLRAGTEYVLVLACDAPLAGPALDRVLAAPPARATVAGDVDGTRQPLVARYHRHGTLEVIERRLRDNTLSMMGLLDDLVAVVVPAGQDDLVNINTAADLARAAALYARRGPSPAPGRPPGAAP